MAAEPVSGWTIAEAIGTILAATAAAIQIWLYRRDANARAIIEHLREVDRRVQATWPHDSESSRADVLAYYRRVRTDLTEGAAAYLGLLNALDVLAFAAKNKLVARRALQEHIDTILNPRRPFGV